MMDWNTLLDKNSIFPNIYLTIKKYDKYTIAKNTIDIMLYCYNHLNKVNIFLVHDFIAKYLLVGYGYNDIILTNLIFQDEKKVFKLLLKMREKFDYALYKNFAAIYDMYIANCYIKTSSDIYQLERVFYKNDINRCNINQCYFNQCYIWNQDKLLHPLYKYLPSDIIDNLKFIINNQQNYIHIIEWNYYTKKADMIINAQKFGAKAVIMYQSKEFHENMWRSIFDFHGDDICTGQRGILGRFYRYIDHNNSFQIIDRHNHDCNENCPCKMSQITIPVFYVKYHEIDDFLKNINCNDMVTIGRNILGHSFSDEKGNNILHITVYQNNLKFCHCAVKLCRLLRHKKNHDGLNPIELAKHLNFIEIFEFLSNMCAICYWRYNLSSNECYTCGAKNTLLI